MKAIITTLPGKSVLQEVPMPEMNEDSVLIQLKYCGVCYSEHYEWKTKGGAFGHEPMGTIVQVGKNVEGFSVGDRVSGLWGSTLPGAGGMVQYAVANPSKDTVVKLPENVRDEDLVLEPLACIYSAVSKAHCSMPGTHVCVVGCGYMGCGAISLLKARGCYVVAVDIRESSRRDALKYGAQEAYSPQEALEKYGTESGHPGFEMVMEWGGNQRIPGHCHPAHPHVQPALRGGVSHRRETAGGCTAAEHQSHRNAVRTPAPGPTL